MYFCYTYIIWECDWYLIVYIQSASMDLLRQLELVFGVQIELISVHCKIIVEYIITLVHIDRVNLNV